MGIAKKDMPGHIRLPKKNKALIEEEARKNTRRDDGKGRQGARAADPQEREEWER